VAAGAAHTADAAAGAAKASDAEGTAQTGLASAEQAKHDSQASSDTKLPLSARI
jgi:hypothetical protein